MDKKWSKWRGEERKNFPCGRITTSASPEACGGSDNDEDHAGQLGSKRWVSVMADASAKGQAEDGGFLWSAMGRHFRFEGWLTKSDLHFKSVLLAGVWRLEYRFGGCREAGRKLLQKCAGDNGHSDCAVAVRM